MRVKMVCLVVALIASASGISQSSEDSLFRFDVNRYDRLKKRNQDHYFLEDSTKITIHELDSVYYMGINKPNSHYSIVCRYFKSTLILKKRMEFFQESKVGVEKAYNEHGDLLYAHNYDSVIVFRLQDLARELHSKYNLDIMSLERAISVQIETSFKPIYNIAYPVVAEEPFRNWRYLQFDGVTGEKLADFEKAYECRTK